MVNYKKPKESVNNLLLAKGLPQNIEVERAILGAIILNNNLANQCLELKVKSEEFMLVAHQKIYQSLVNLSNANCPIDPILLADDLRKTNDLEDCGNISYIASLMDGTIRESSISHYINILKQKYFGRKLIEVANKSIVAAIEDNQNIYELLVNTENELSAIAEDNKHPGIQHVSDLIYEEINKIDLSIQNPDYNIGLSTGFHQLDQILGGSVEDDIIVIGARSSQGKTALGINIIVNTAMIHDAPIAVFSLEMTASALLKRMLCSEARVNPQRLANKVLTSVEWDRLNDAVNKIGRLNILIDDMPNQTISQIKAKIKYLKKKHNIGLVLIDYIQLIRPNKDAKDQQKNLEISDICKELQGLAKEVKTPIIELCQLNRGTEHRENPRPQMKDLEGSGGIEQNAVKIILIYREEFYKPTDENVCIAEFIVAKNRNGQLDNVKVAFIKELTRFENLYVG